MTPSALRLIDISPALQHKGATMSITSKTTKTI